MSVIDGYSKYSWVYCLKTKDEAKQKVKEFITEFERIFSKNRTIKSDNGGEFVNKNLKQYFIEKGITLSTSIPYEHEMVGTVERVHRTILAKARKMLFNSKLPSNFWGDAVITANLLRNVSWSSSINDIPFKKLHEIDFPFYHKLKVFGCVALTRVEREKRNKLQKQGKRAVFIGYEKDYSYRFWCPNARNIYRSRNAHFFEREFDYQNGKIDDYDFLKDFSFSPHLETPASETIEIEIQSQLNTSCQMEEIKRKKKAVQNKIVKEKSDSVSELESDDEVLEPTIKTKPVEIPVANNLDGIKKPSAYKEFQKIQEEAQNLAKESDYGKHKRSSCPKRIFSEINNLDLLYDATEAIPKSLKQAQKSNNWEMWKNAIDRESIVCQKTMSGRW